MKKSYYLVCILLIFSGVIVGFFVGFQQAAFKPMISIDTPSLKQIYEGEGFDLNSVFIRWSAYTKKYWVSLSVERDGLGIEAEGESRRLDWAMLEATRKLSCYGKSVREEGWQMLIN